MIDAPLHERVLHALLRRAAEEEGDRPFLRYRETQMSYAQVWDEARRVAGGLTALEVRPGDKVCLMATNADCLEFVTTWFGVVAAGGVVVPINPDFKGDLLALVLEDSDARHAVVAAEFLGRIDEVIARAPAVRTIVQIGGGAQDATDRPYRLVPLDDLPSSNGSDGLPPGRHSDVATIVYSSGTTGAAKGIVMSHAHAFSFARQWCALMRYTREDRLYSPTPLSYMLATILGVLPSLLVRGEICFAPRFSASSYWDDIRAYEATVAHCIFSVIPILKKQPPSELDRRHNCRALYIAKSDPEFEERFGVRLVEIYGSTEMNIVAYNPWDAPKPGSCGLPAPNFEVQIVDDDDQPLPQGQTGEIVARPREPFLLSYGYYKKPEVTIQAWANLWFHCGDRGYLDDDGYLWYVDRKKDVIRRRGENISSYELERQITSHPDVLECAAVPVPSDLGEDDVMVYVVLTDPALAQVPGIHRRLLDDWLERLPRFMVPRYVEFVDELPKTQSMKIRKVDLRERGVGAMTFDRDADAVVGTVAGTTSRTEAR